MRSPFSASLFSWSRSKSWNGRRAQHDCTHWRGTVRETDKDIYHEYLKKTGLREYAATPGIAATVHVASRRNGKGEFLLTTLWDSWDAIKAFAGSDYEKAVYYPEDEKFLLVAGAEGAALRDDRTPESQGSQDTVCGLLLCVMFALS